MAEFRFNDGWEDELRRAIEPQMRQIQADLQERLDRLGSRYAGCPVAQIKPVLAQEWGSAGRSITDPELTQFATLISEGSRVEVVLH